MRVSERKVNWCVFYIHQFVDFLPVLEYIMRNRTEQNRTEQNRTEQNRTEQCDALRASVKPYFQKSDMVVGSFHSERATIKQVNRGLKDNKFYLLPAHIQEV